MLERQVFKLRFILLKLLLRTNYLISTILVRILFNSKVSMPSSCQEC